MYLHVLTFVHLLCGTTPYLLPVPCHFAILSSSIYTAAPIY